MQMPFCWDQRSAAAHAPENHVAINGTVVVSCHMGLSVPGKTTTLRLFSSTQMDANTGKGKLSAEAPLRNGKKSKAKQQQPVKTTSIMTYQVTFLVDAEFGTPGAVVVKSGLRNDQFFLRHVRLDMPEDGRSIHFECNSWMYPYKKTNADRVFFINTSYLPDKTPEALRLLREEELRSLRGNGRGERKDWERIYDYDYYNDLGDPDKEDHARPVLGGTTSMYPYPRRCRTGRPHFKTDGVTETRKHMINLDFYIPPDERFSPTKLAEVLTLAAQAVTHLVLPETRALFHGNINSFRSFDQLKSDLYSKPQQAVGADGQVMDKLKTSVPSNKTYKQVSKMVKETPFKFPIPQVIEHDPEAWRSDEEFAREMLAGLNPVVIKRLEVFPPVSRGGKPSSITVENIERQLQGRTVEKALDEKRLYILDHHDYLMPYLRRINTQQGVCAYASRTLLFLKDDGTLKPLVIELSLPGDGDGDGGEISRVFLPASQGTDGHLWWLAKAHVSVNDSGYHQLISHWLFTHATVEPFIIATKRQLSAMHPIHKLLEPHFKDNMQINTLARSILLSAGGILETTMFPGKYAMEMSSAIYSEWRFTDQALPNDLVKRGMASSNKDQLHLHVEDYPYAVDGMDVWHAIAGWVRSYCAHFYHSDTAVAADAELQAWWHDVRTVGHGDRQRDPACWLDLDTVANLAESLSTLIWIASALHAAVNFGQYGYAGFMPNRPTRCRRFVPLPESPEMAQLEADPDRFFLDTVPDRFTTTLGLTLIEVLSNHTSDELYLGQRATASWTDDGKVLQLLDRFREELHQVEKRITERNRDPRFKNRRGPAKVPYTLLFPDVGGKEKGITGKGIPNSVSI